MQNPLSIRRVLVVGAGAAGLIIAECLRAEQAFEEVEVFEKRPSLGHETIDKAEGSQANPPAGIKFLHEVVSLTLVSAEQHNKWNVGYRVQGEAEQQQIYDAIVIASGRADSLKLQLPSWNRSFVPVSLSECFSVDLNSSISNPTIVDQKLSSSWCKFDEPTISDFQTYNLYQHTFPIDLTTESTMLPVAFLRKLDTVAPFQMMRLQASIIAGVLSGRLNLPSATEIKSWTDTEQAIIQGTSPLTTLGYPRDLEYWDSFYDWSIANGELDTDGMIPQNPKVSCKWGQKENRLWEQFRAAKLSSHNVQEGEVSFKGEFGFHFVGDIW